MQLFALCLPVIEVGVRRQADLVILRTVATEISECSLQQVARPGGRIAVVPFAADLLSQQFVAESPLAVLLCMTLTVAMARGNILNRQMTINQATIQQPGTGGLG